jgi:hypothetical protein
MLEVWYFTPYPNNSGTRFVSLFGSGSTRLFIILKEETKNVGNDHRYCSGTLAYRANSGANFRRHPACATACGCSDLYNPVIDGAKCRVNPPEKNVLVVSAV